MVYWARVFANKSLLRPTLRGGLVRAIRSVSAINLLTSYIDPMSSLFLFDNKVTGITKTTNNHQSILDAVGKSDRFHVSTMEDCQGKKFDNVVFCAPPSGFEDYAGAVADAATNVWTGLDSGGTFVFTSSGGVYVQLPFSKMGKHQS